MAKNDPENTRVMFYQAYMNWRERHDPQALLTTGQRLQSLGSPWANITLASYYAAVGDFERGAKAFAARQSAFGSTLSASDSEKVYHPICSGGDAVKAAIAVLDAHPADQWVATVSLEIGEPERAFAEFEKSSAGLSDAYLNWLWQPEAWSVKARQHPAFQGFAKRIGLVDYWKKYGWPDACKPAPETGPDAFSCQ